MVRISGIEIYHEKIRYKEPFRIALGTSTESNNIVVRLVDSSGNEGWGEGSPSRAILGETLDLVFEEAKKLAAEILGKDLDSEGLYEIVMKAKSPSAAAAFDIAFHDLKAKRLGVPLYKLLGGYRSSIETDITIGIMEPDEVAERAEKYVKMGFKVLKIKLGEKPEKDLLRIEKVRERIGDKIGIRVDANQGWSVEEAIYMAEQLESFNVELIEQPVKWNDFEGLAKVRKASNIPVAADESAKTPSDVVKLAKIDAVDIVNIKLMKTRGIWGAIKVAAVSEAAGIKNMIGCMGETRLGITAAVHVSQALANITINDLDSDLLHGEEVVIEGGASISNGVRRAGDRPGLGIVKLDMSKLRLISRYGKV